ncbi:MAG TPA: DUF2177 domain-containing protein [Rhodospirillaceae bacterium]|nr:DUF2177 domain-containing protein [Rhodospirillaceae bacterium]
MITKYIATYIATLLIFLVIDGIWLGLVARGFYVQQLGSLLRPSPNFGAAGLFYALYVMGILVFVIFPALNHGTWITAVLYGALFGLIAYATYDLTNLATLQGWPIVMSVVDMIWGAMLTATVAAAGYFAARIICN